MQGLIALRWQDRALTTGLRAAFLLLASGLLGSVLGAQVTVDSSWEPSVAALARVGTWLDGILKVLLFSLIQSRYLYCVGVFNQVSRFQRPQEFPLGRSRHCSHF